MFKITALTSLLVALATACFAQQPAFPGAEGGGMYTTGGRGGKVLYVTSLADDGSEGTLRWALEQEYPRIILFSVGGTIRLEKPLNIRHGHVTIAGQSAPGDGICLRDYPVFFNGVEQVVMRFLRFRMGDETNVENDALGGKYNTDMIIDHCSSSWSTDECASFYANKNFTLQWSIVSESLNTSVHAKGSHGFGGIWGGKNASFHHNLLASNNSRNPRIDHPFIYRGAEQWRGFVDVRNNVIYNWGSNNTYGGEGGSFNLIGNYYKKGPATHTREDYFVDAWGIYAYLREPENVGYPNLYMEGNHFHGNPNGINEDRSQWIHYDEKIAFNRDNNILSKPLPINGVQDHTTTQPAEKACELVLAVAGASLVRDAVDMRAVNDTRSGKARYMEGGRGSKGGLVDTPSAVGGWPEYKGGKAPVDSDGDGMPDTWEQANGLNANDPADGAVPAKNGYTNVENYLNFLVAHIVAQQQ